MAILYAKDHNQQLQHYQQQLQTNPQDEVSQLGIAFSLLNSEKYSDARLAIEKLRNTLLYAEVDVNEPGVDDDDYHVQQLLGLRAELEDGSEYGVVADVLNLPAQDCLAIKTKSGEVLIPFVHQLVPIVDLKGKRVVVIPPVVS